MGKTVDDLLWEAIGEELKEEMEKEASNKEASTPASSEAEIPERHEEFSKLAEQLRELISKEENTPNSVEDLKDTVETAEE